jgi:heme-degrading monooxygenase HmoA
MITAIVQFSLPKPISFEEAARAFESTAPKYQGLRGLVRKYYLRSEDDHRAGGVYLWETRAAAEAVFNNEWKARVKQLYGSEPEITWFDTPGVVGNQAGGTSATLKVERQTCTHHWMRTFSCVESQIKDNALDHASSSSSAFASFRSRVSNPSVNHP